MERIHDWAGILVDELWSIEDFFREWSGRRIKDGSWHKDNIWGGESAYGPVCVDAG